MARVIKAKGEKGSPLGPEASPFEPPRLVEGRLVGVAAKARSAIDAPADEVQATGQEVSGGPLQKIMPLADFPFGWRNVVIQFRRHHAVEVEPDLLATLLASKAPIRMEP